MVVPISTQNLLAQLHLVIKQAIIAYTRDLELLAFITPPNPQTYLSILQIIASINNLIQEHLLSAITSTVTVPSINC